MREKKKVDRPGGEDGHDTEADVGAEGPFFLAGDSTANHDHEIESETSHFRHFFFSNKFLTKTRSPRVPASPMPATAFLQRFVRTAGDEEAANELAESESVEAGVPPAKFFKCSRHACPHRK